MEIANTTSRRYGCPISNSELKREVAIPKVFLSNEEAIQSLESKRIVLIQPREEGYSEIFKAWLAVLLIMSAAAAVFAFVADANNHSWIDHSRDRNTSHACIFDNATSNIEHMFVMNCKRYRDQGFINSEGFWIDHTADRWMPNIQRGLLSMALTLFVAPLVLLACHKASRVYARCTLERQYQKDVQHMQKLADAKCTLFSFSDGGEPVDPAFLPKLVEFDALSLNLLAKLSFPQIARLKSDCPQFFAEQLSQHTFSKEQCLYWNKLHAMLKASPEEIIGSLRNSRNGEIFQQELRLLETFMWELDTQKFNLPLKKALAATMSEQAFFDGLSREALLTIIDLVARRKVSFEEALALQGVDTSKVAGKIKLGFDDGSSLKVSKAFLIQASPVFHRMLSADFKERLMCKIPLKETDQGSFKAALRYLKTSQLQISEIDLEPILKVADQYQFMSLKLKIEKELFLNLDTLLVDLSFGALLHLCEKFNLSQLKKALDMKLSYRCLNSEFQRRPFLTNLELASEFQLAETFDALSTICRQILEQEKLSDKQWTRLLCDVASSLPNDFEALFNSMRPAFLKRPALLQKLWDTAQETHSTTVEGVISSFCQKRENVLIYLQYGPLPPAKIPLKQLVIR